MSNTRAYANRPIPASWRKPRQDEATFAPHARETERTARERAKDLGLDSEEFRAYAWLDAMDR